eukprot:NODE_11341_length_553_cov_5.051163_g11057_i0.p1 GENE.NODE_11341_length_553_cov_5.051163_g11057_i0~~NODE_11341_length_553_cov_5.051163_g11057_i0.p1  ORF type:complete len:126 (+),score=0.14 NODE_11341_length_553_cov_5.051163_g11057_i0:142-519(+)
MNKNRKLVKKFFRQNDAYLASSSLIRSIPRVLGPQLGRAGKFPSVLAADDDIEAVVNRLRSTVKFQLKKQTCLGCVVGHVHMGAADLRLNILLALNFLVSLLKKNWQNLKAVYIKSSMGRPYRVL